MRADDVRIKVIGVGGAGGNAISSLVDQVPPDVDLWAANTDSQALQRVRGSRLLPLGVARTQGLGAGGRPEVGEASALDSAPEISDALRGADVVFVTAGMGGGTGTGGAAVVAAAARAQGALTIGVFSRPFGFEGRRRAKTASEGLAHAEHSVDCCVVIENQRLLTDDNEDLSMHEAFARADQVLSAGVRSITELLVGRGVINLDLADLRVCLAAGGRAMLGLGRGATAVEATTRAVACELLADTDLRGAGGLLVSFRGPRSLRLREIDAAVTWLSEQTDPEAEILFGLVVDDTLEEVEATVVATGLTGSNDAQNAANVAAPSSPRARSSSPRNALLLL